MLFTAIDHPAIASRDVRRLADWYCQHLGMKVLADNQQQPPSLLLGFEQGVNSKTLLELMPVREEGPEPVNHARFAPGLRHLAFRVGSFDQAHAQLSQAGVSFLSTPLDAIGGGRIVSFRDIDGNELQIVERPVA